MNPQPLALCLNISLLLLHLHLKQKILLVQVNAQSTNFISVLINDLSIETPPITTECYLLMNKCGKKGKKGRKLELKNNVSQ